MEHNKHDLECLKVCARTTKEVITSKLRRLTQTCREFSDSIQKLEDTSRLFKRCEQLSINEIHETANSLIVDRHTAAESNRKRITMFVKNEEMTRGRLSVTEVFSSQCSIEGKGEALVGQEARSELITRNFLEECYHCVCPGDYQGHPMSKLSQKPSRYDSRLLIMYKECINV